MSRLETASGGEEGLPIVVVVVLDPQVVHTNHQLICYDLGLFSDLAGGKGSTIIH